MAVPKVKHVSEKAAEMGPTVPAPDFVYEDGPTETSKIVKYAPGDPVPMEEARSLGFDVGAVRAADADEEPAPRHASARGRKVRAVDREKR